METEMNGIDTTEDDLNRSSPPIFIYQDYLTVESPPPIEEAIWEEFEKQFKRTQELLLEVKPVLINTGYNSGNNIGINCRPAPRIKRKREVKVCVAMEKLEEEYESLKQMLKKRHADLLNPSDQENMIVDLKSEVEKIKVDIKCKEETELIKWKPVTNGQIGPDAVGGGEELYATNTTPTITYVGRGLANEQLVPGKIILNAKTSEKSFYCLIINKWQQQKMCTEFEYLVKPTFGKLAWKPASRGRVPTGAVVGGKAADGEPLFVGRTEFEETDSEKHLIIGMVQPSRLALKLLWKGVVKTNREYEVLCHVYD